MHAGLQGRNVHVQAACYADPALDTGATIPAILQPLRAGLGCQDDYNATLTATAERMLHQDNDGMSRDPSSMGTAAVEQAQQQRRRQKEKQLQRPHERLYSEHFKKMSMLEEQRKLRWVLMRACKGVCEYLYG